MSKDNKSIIKDFNQAVNTTPKEIESWLKTEQSNIRC